MKDVNKIQRRDFLKVNGLIGAGLVLGFNLYSCKGSEEIRKPASEWTDINAYLTIADNGEITIFSPNPEIGQGVKTSMPMLIAEELDADWNDVIVKQAPYDDVKYFRQVAGGSQSIRKGWTALRTAGATARDLLIGAAAVKWGIEKLDCSTENGYVIGPDKQKLSYGELAASAATLEIPTDVKLKDPKDFKIIGQSKKNVDLSGIVKGESLFGMDFYREGMVYANVLKGPFGATVKKIDDTAARAIEGVLDVFEITGGVAIVAKDTWTSFKGKKALVVEWQQKDPNVNSDYFDAELKKLLNKQSSNPKRNDGDVAKAFAEADEIVERVYEAPFLAHNTMAPMNFFADVTVDKVECVGPIQTPAWTQGKIAKLLDVDPTIVHIDMTRMGGGFGRRLYGDFATEACEISQKISKPVKVVYQREDDMQGGIYRPASKYKFKAAIKDKQVTGYELVGVSVNDGNAVRANNFPAGAIDNYRIVAHELKSEITVGAWRAPVTNFLAYAEQSFMDELAVACNLDPVEFRLNLLDKALANSKSSTDTQLDYEPLKFKGVIEDVVKHSNFGKADKHQGLSAYYSHNTYVAEVADINKEDPSRIEKIHCSIDCGIVVNPEGAINQAQGGVVDGMGHAMYGELTLKDGMSVQANFDQFRIIRMPEVPDVDIHFIKSNNDPTGLGEPTLPPAGGAVANAFFQATGRRIYKQPFIKELEGAEKLG
ncbi:molybdopterin-dependent oxidoreductase [Saprospiraceae bacterium]|nr:molybdopterin-dependent oxidoreductase [Saprospiraceae bacterium]